MSFFVRAYLLVGLSFCIFPLSSIADEVKEREEPSQVASDPAPSAEENKPGEVADKPEISSESTEEAPPKLSSNAEESKSDGPSEQADSQEETAPKSLGNWDTSTNPLDVSDLEGKSATIKKISDDLKEAIELADLLTLRLDALDSRAATQNQSSSSFVVSAPHVVADKVHVFIMADTRPISGGRANAVATGARANADMMEALLKSQCIDASTSNQEDHLAASVVRVLKDGEFSFQILERELTAANVGTNDVLFVYFACHGGTFNDSDRSHFFQTPNPRRNNNEVLARREVWKLMKGKGARQTILISDTCSNATSVTPYSISPLTVAAPATNALSRLLLYQIGDLDISGSSRPPFDNGDGSRNGQFGIYNDTGGFFTIAFLSASLNTRDPLSWKKLLDNAQRELDGEVSPGVPVNVFGRIVTMTRQTYELVLD